MFVKNSTNKKTFNIIFLEYLKNKKYISSIILTLIILIYSIISFINLGDFKMPKTMWVSSSNKQVIFSFDNISHVKKIQYLPGPAHNLHFNIYYTKDFVNWESIKDIEIKHSNVFTWQEIDLDIDAICFNIITNSDNMQLLEVAFRDSYNNLISYNVNEKNLSDEQNLVPETPSYKNGMYFDEIYHARTAYEMINKTEIYEVTHPPLGKFIISLGIRIFGMNPFGWRVFGNLFGILMIPIMYLFSKQIFKDKFWPIFTTIIFTFDFMHFSQTRIATIDTYITIFIMLMYYFMYKYYFLSFSNCSINKLFIPLGLSGIFMGIGIATKWQGVYSAIGLFIIFMISILNKFKEYCYASFKRSKRSISKNIFLNFLIKIFSFSLIFFVLIPIFIYFLSYIPYLGTKNFNNINDILNNQTYMYNYHKNLESSHYYSSKWWEWPILVKPILYYSGTICDKKIGISSFGNPAVWLFGIFAFFYTIFYSIEKKSKISIFLLISYLSQYVPWIFIKRTTFIYHYFPSVPFIALMITFTFKELLDKQCKLLKYIYLIIVLILFLMFYPVISGYPISQKYVETFLKWFSGWVLIL